MSSKTSLKMTQLPVAPEECGMWSHTWFKDEDFRFCWNCGVGEEKVRHRDGYNWNFATWGRYLKAKRQAKKRKEEYDKERAVTIASLKELEE